MKTVRIVAILLVCMLGAAWGCSRTIYPLGYMETAEVKGKLGLELVAREFGTLTLIRCTDATIEDCDLAHLILIECVGVSVENCRFSGTGTAITVEKSVSVDIFNISFTEGTYDVLLDQIKSVDVEFVR
ncbi:MAG: hypothetical protein JW885_11800 [Deltaproteobacteria bacterium]|nr:hypothetical protein [Candidatus Zymogenaceae bacterium]